MIALESFALNEDANCCANATYFSRSERGREREMTKNTIGENKGQICAGRHCVEGLRLGVDMEHSRGLVEVVYDTEGESSAGH